MLGGGQTPTAPLRHRSQLVAKKALRVGDVMRSRFTPVASYTVVSRGRSRRLDHSRGRGRRGQPPDPDSLAAAGSLEPEGRYRDLADAVDAAAIWPPSMRIAFEAIRSPTSRSSEAEFREILDRQVRARSVMALRFWREERGWR